MREVLFGFDTKVTQELHVQNLTGINKIKNYMFYYIFIRNILSQIAHSISNRGEFKTQSSFRLFPTAIIRRA